MKKTPDLRPIETDEFEFEFLSAVANRESWRKEIHRPVYHVHKWWAKRLGSIFRGILLGCVTDRKTKLEESFYQIHDMRGLTVFDPFLGSGTTVGEAHKLGLTAFGRDINPVAVNAVRVALGPMKRQAIETAYHELEEGVQEPLLNLYRSKDRGGRECDVLYYFWVMQTHCPGCDAGVDLFSSYVFASNAYPKRKPEVQVVCPGCGAVFEDIYGATACTCPSCSLRFNPQAGPADRRKASCRRCKHTFDIIPSLGKKRPEFRLYAKLVLTQDGRKEYVPATDADLAAYRRCSTQLTREVKAGRLLLPTLHLTDGYNTRQALSYNFSRWTDFFNDRQLLALSTLRAAILASPDHDARQALLTVFSGALEFNNMFASYKGEGTGAVRHMFSHHVLKPERTPIEANLWGTSKSSGSFSGLYRNRLFRAMAYRESPTEVTATGSEKGIVCSAAFTGKVEEWPTSAPFTPRGIYLSCGNSAATGLPASSVDLVVTDPPFFDNVHYSELADFFHAWQQLADDQNGAVSTRNPCEVQDTQAASFANKLAAVFRECGRVLKDDGLLVFSYHHSRDDGWQSVAEAVLSAGFQVVNSHPVKAEMSVATPKAQAKEPIQFDIILVCRRSEASRKLPTVQAAKASAQAKAARLEQAGFKLSRNDHRVILFGQLLTTLRTPEEAVTLPSLASPGEPSTPPTPVAPQGAIKLPAEADQKTDGANTGKPGRKARAAQQRLPLT